MLAFIFSEDLNFGKPLGKGCQASEAQNFLDKLYPSLKSLVNEEPSMEAMNSRTIFNAQDSDSNELLPGSNSAKIEREENIRLFNVICKLIKVTVLEWNLQSISNFHKIYPILCQLENKEKSKEISIACTEALAIMAQSLALPENIPTVLEAINNVSKSLSWSARDNCLEFLQVFVFYNMSVLLSDEKWITTIQNIVLRLLEDERLEVREKAAQVLSGLFHCTVIPNQESLLEKFKEKAKTKLSKKRKRVSSTEEELPTNIKTINDMHSRHTGVLGMCAFIRAHPYDIPKYILPIFESLTMHLNDPEPIPSTIRKTLNEFKRTHCDGWTGLQGLAEKFTEEQFAVLQDLSIPPSYYA